MSGRFLKCLDQECGRLLFKRNNDVYKCHGCKRTYQAEDLIKREQIAKQEDTIFSKGSLNGQIDNSKPNMPFPKADHAGNLQPSTSPPSNSMVTKTYPMLNKTNPNYARKDFKGSRSSASSVSSEELIIESEQNGRTDETIVARASSVSSDDSNGTICRNSHAVSRRTRKKEVSNVEENEIKYPPNQLKMNLNPGKMDLRDNTSSLGGSSSVNSDEEIEALYERYGYSSGRNLNPSLESNYHLNQSNIDSKPTKIDLKGYSGSARSSVIRDSNTSFEGSISSRSSTSDEGGDSRVGSGYSRFKSKRTQRPRTEFYEAEKPINPIAVPNSNQQKNDLNAINELAKLDEIREKLIMLLVQQSDNDQNRNKRTLMRKLSFASSSMESRQTESIASYQGKRKPAKHHCRPVLGGTPFVICQNCCMLLQLPIGLPKKGLIKIRCGECDEMRVYRFPAKDGPYNPLHKQMGYESARFLLDSRQFSNMDVNVIM